MFTLTSKLDVKSHCAYSPLYRPPAQPTAQFHRNLIYCYLQTLTLNPSLIILLRHSSIACWLHYRSYLSIIHTPNLNFRKVISCGGSEGSGRLFSSTVRVQVIKPLVHLRQVSSLTKEALFKAWNKGHYYQAVKVCEIFQSRDLVKEHTMFLYDCKKVAIAMCVTVHKYYKTTEPWHDFESRSSESQFFLGEMLPSKQERKHLLAV